MRKNIYYDSAKQRIPFIAEIRELLRHKDLLMLLIVYSIKTRYKRSTLGIIWTLLNPVLYMAVMTIAFSEIFRFSLTDYPVYLLSGLIAWNFFSQTTTQAVSSLVWGGTLLKRVYLPRSIFAVAAIGNGVINLLLSCIPLLIIMLIMHHPVYVTWWFLPIAILILSAVSLGFALIISIIAVFFIDVVDIYQVILQAGFYLTPVMYPDSILPARIREFLFLNPVYDVVKVFRLPLYNGTLPSMFNLLTALAAALLVLLLGWWLFTRKSHEIPYRI